ncbi:hypothetical protein B0H13DRAFT_2326935 [Mycena leptocephala]|nr:hypothetical protein B0H13DRAFT_2326935 [Mycena leptocephala]
MSFEHEAQRWDKRAGQVPIGVIPRAEALGAIAFAKRQAHMFRDLSHPTVAREIEMENEEDRIREETLKDKEEEAELASGMIDSDDEEYVFSGMAEDD